ncbi:hypothetical protein R6L23_15500, partial [Streptomyces sp. SR27]|uniref:hypothetical protein n=1 Tax=Streptomyces sp. SR27 TaxID=3076630 RepID=UPI00295AE585
QEAPPRDRRQERRLSPRPRLCSAAVGHSGPPAGVPDARAKRHGRRRRRAGDLVVRLPHGIGIARQSVTALWQAQ